MVRTATYVLLVDQDPVRSDLFHTSLEEAGFRVYHAHEADEALAMLGDDPSIAGMATCWDLGELNGLKLIRKMIKQADFEGAIVLYECPKPLLAEEKLEEWTDGEIDYVVLEQPTDSDQVVEALNDLLGTDEDDDF